MPGMRRVVEGSSDALTTRGGHIEPVECFIGIFRNANEIVMLAAIAMVNVNSVGTPVARCPTRSGRVR